RRQHHKDLRDLTDPKAALIAYLLSHLTLVCAENVSQNAPRISLPRRGSLLPIKDHSGQSGKIIEDAAVMIVSKCTIQAFRTLRRRSVACQAAQYRRQRRLHRRVNGGRIGTNGLTYLA